VRIVGHIAFCGDLDDAPDPDAAEIELRRAGYAVARLPDRLQKRIRIPGDDFMQAFTDVAGAVDEMEIAGVIMDELNEIVDRYGGACYECGPEPADYEPAFDDLFEAMPRSH
jgi:hypothetical protein